MARKNYKQVALKVCATDLAAHYDQQCESFHQLDPDGNSTAREDVAYRAAMREVIRALFEEAGFDWTHPDDTRKT